MSSVMTVTGPVSSEELGFTLMHEHLFIDLMRDAYVGNNILNDPDLAEIELQRYKEAGGLTLVDQTCRGMGQDPAAVREVAIGTELNIILGCGWYREPYYDRRLYHTKTDQIADEIVRDIREGIDGTGIRPGIIGEIGTQSSWVSPVEERVFRAVARAHKETGLTICTHAVLSPVGVDQLDILQEEGVDPRRVVVGHVQGYPHLEYYSEIARRGAFLGFDKMIGPNEYGIRKSVRLVRQVLDAGLIEHLLFSQDVCYKSELVNYGGTGYDFIITQLPRYLQEVGVTEEEFHRITVENPRRALTGDD